MRKLSSLLNILIIALVAVIGGAFFYLKLQPVDEKKILQLEMSSQELDDIVNKHIKDTVSDVRKTKIMTEKSMIETRNKLAELERLKKLKEEKENAKIPLERQIWKAEVQETESSPSRVINEKIYEKNQQDKMDEAEKQEYARQWIQNARRAGYLLELSPDLEVIKYTPIRKPSQQDDSAESQPSD